MLNSKIKTIQQLANW